VREIQLFDVYTGDGIPVDKKSMALRLTLQDDTATLEDAQVEEICTAVVEALTTKLSVTLRSF
jgi:phenylalanyl-tRNA synthetase beta chain